MSLSESQLARVQAETLDRVQRAKRRLDHSRAERDYINVFGATETDEFSPTKERQGKGDTFVPPEFSQTTRRPYHRSLHKFEDLYQNGKINQGCYEAGSKLMTHFYGAQGVNVASGEGDGGEPLEFARSYHAQKLMEARKHIGNPNRWCALTSVIEETRTLEQIGREWLSCKDFGRAYIAGLALVSMALEDLSVLWGFSQSYHSRPPSR